MGDGWDKLNLKKIDPQGKVILPAKVTKIAWIGTMSTNIPQLFSMPLAIIILWLFYDSVPLDTIYQQTSSHCE